MESANATPMQFGLKVRSHPDALMVTARAKMGSGRPVKISIGLSNRFVETAILRRDRKALSRNRRAVVAFTSALRSIGLAPEDAEEVGRNGSSRLVRSVPVRLIIDFLRAFQNHQASMYTEPGPVGRYIENRSMHDLKEWDVLFVGVKGSPIESDRLCDSSLGFKLNCQRRTEGEDSDDDTLMITNNQRVASRGVEMYGLSKDRVRRAQEGYLNERNIDPESGIRVNFPDRIFRAVRISPLLVIHLLEILKRGERSVDQPVVAWSMSFPRTTQEEEPERVEWIVNTTWFREQYQEESEDEETGDDE